MTEIKDNSTVRIEVLAEAARAVGFSRTAALRVAVVEDEFKTFYAAYLARGISQSVAYLARPERFDLHSILQNAKTLVLFAYPYRFATVEAKLKKAPYKVARYAWQRDYHAAFKEKLYAVLASLNLTGRVVTDSAPLLERYWARRAGLGFIGKNGMLIDQNSGSFFMLAAALVAEELEGDIPLRKNAASPARDIADFCRDCSRCVDACPTGALLGDGLMQTERCISYQTIETHGEVVYPQGSKNHRWLFGCDICQQVCPYNKAVLSFADDKFNDEHSSSEAVAAGKLDMTRSSLKDSVFHRRGAQKLELNLQALNANSRRRLLPSDLDNLK